MHVCLIRPSAAHGVRFISSSRLRLDKKVDHSHACMRLRHFHTCIHEHKVNKTHTSFVIYSLTHTRLTALMQASYKYVVRRRKHLKMLTFGVAQQAQPARRLSPQHAHPRLLARPRRRCSSQVCGSGQAVAARVERRCQEQVCVPANLCVSRECAGGCPPTIFARAGIFRQAFLCTPMLFAHTHTWSGASSNIATWRVGTLWRCMLCTSRSRRASAACSCPAQATASTCPCPTPA